MDKFDRIYALHTILGQARRPVGKAKIEQELECSHATAERLIKEMRLYLDAPIEYDRTANGYYYNESQAGEKYELPGLWFNASELHALLTIHHLLASIEPGLIEGHIAPLRKKINKILDSRAISTSQVAKRVRILKIAARQSNPKHFNLVATSLLTRKRLFIHYSGRDREKVTEREVSPQRLIFYRDNWYLDAWCHLREALRSFSLNRINTSKLINADTVEIEDQELDKYFSTSYGIFSGKPTHVAKLRFSPRVAKWIAEEQWHPQQKGQFALDGTYELEIPYRDPRELIMDILKYGADVQVLGPDILRKDIKDKLSNALNHYK